MMRNIQIFMIAMLLFAVPASASVDDVNGWIGNTIKTISQAAQKLSLPSYGSITIKCNSGAVCAQEGENWIIAMSAMSNAQTFDLELQPGIKSVSGTTEFTTGASVRIQVTEKAPIQTVPVTLNSDNKYILRTGFMASMVSYPVKAYERSGISSTITTNYEIVLNTADTTTAPITKSYDYRQPQAIYLKDNLGNIATITPSHQVSGGITTDVSGVFFVDNGYGSIEAFDKVNFKNYLDKVNTEVQFVSPWDTGKLPMDWAQFLARMKALGLLQYTDLSLSLSGTNNIIISYPVGSVGTQLQAVIPKAMAKTITVIQNWGDPLIDSATLSPQSITKGQGFATLTVMVTNRGSTDTINVAAIVNGATVTAVTNSLRLSQGQQGTFIFSLNPTVSVDSSTVVTIIATAGGSGYQAKKDVILTIKVPSATNPPTTQKIIVKTLSPDGEVISNAPIFKNGVQMGIGQYEDTIPLGRYVFTTNNISNPKLFAPTQRDITLTGGEPQTVNLFFSYLPQQDPIDMTWIFWGALALVVGFIMFKQGIFASLAKNPLQLIVIIILLFVLYMMYLVYLMLTGVADTITGIAANPILPWNWF
ncbi:MAG: hypothetical protein PHP06_06015 [Clostridia bacterium]|nr:hypothetical protein [Clostridia bacterium]